MHNGPSTQSARSALCCGSEPQVVALSGAASAGRRVELVRCRQCGRSSWLVDGSAVDQARALAALSTAFAPRPAARTGGRPRAATPAPAGKEAGPDLTGLLAGWKVLGASD